MLEETILTDRKAVIIEGACLDKEINTAPSSKVGIPK